MRFVFCFLFFVFAACQTLQYYPDNGLISSGHANAPESLVFINGFVCKNMQGNIGQCAMTTKRNESIGFWIPAQPYGYKLQFVCTSSLKASFQLDVPSNIPLPFEINSNRYIDTTLPEFSCEGNIKHVDNTNSFKIFNVRVKLINSNYIEREEIIKLNHNNNTYLLLGSAAKYGQIEKNGKIKNIKEKTFLKINDTDTIRAWTCSEMERCNYYGF